jgi:hypothetical protein
MAADESRGQSAMPQIVGLLYMSCWKHPFVAGHSAELKKDSSGMTFWGFVVAQL